MKELLMVFYMQCCACWKWRVIPTKAKYEELRSGIHQRPFQCITAREWRSDVSCEDPTDASPDDELEDDDVWGIDEPGIAEPPPGWKRLIRPRAEGSTRFADVYYVAPSGKKLRSMVEVKRFLNSNDPQNEGVNLSQFSFRIPNAARSDYVRKRPTMKQLASSVGLNEVHNVPALEWAFPVPADVGNTSSGASGEAPAKEEKPSSRPCSSEETLSCTPPTAKKPRGSPSSSEETLSGRTPPPAKKDKGSPSSEETLSDPMIKELKARAKKARGH